MERYPRSDVNVRMCDNEDLAADTETEFPEVTSLTLWISNTTVYAEVPVLGVRTRC
jgi:hypothetical protein